MSIRSDIPSPPNRMAGLPIDRRGYPVPRFVAWFRDKKEVNEGYGDPDFRVIRSGWMMRCITFKVCWLCGGALGKNLVFVVGPMCIVNRTSGEPPCHLDCAQYAAKACPFMTNPSRPRNDGNLPEEGEFNPNALGRNPGATALYITRSYKWMNGPKVIRMGEPDRIEWWARGRTATRAEVEHSIDTGIPLLRKVAEEDGPRAVLELENMVDKARAWYPK